MRLIFWLKSILILVVYLCTCTTVFAQNENKSELSDTTMTSIIEDAIISGNTPSTTRQSSPIQVISRSKIEKLGFQELHQAVKTFSGVNIKDYGGVGGLKTVSIRSLGSQHTAVNYDGAVMSNAQNGQVDIGRFNLDNIDQVILSIGQFDDIFQSARMYASAGALTIKTAVPKFYHGPVNLSAQIKLASFGTYNPSLSYEQRLGEKWSLRASGDWLSSKGDYPFILTNGELITSEVRKNSDIQSIRTELNIYGDMGRAGKISLKGNYLDSERGLPGPVIYYVSDAAERLWDKNGFAQAHYENKLGQKWDIQGLLKYNHAYTKYRDEDHKYPNGFSENNYTQDEYYTSVSTKYSPYDFLSFSLAEDFFVNTLEADLPKFSYPTRYTSLTALAGQYKDSRWTATLSLLGTYITEEVKVGEAAGDRKRLSPAASLSFKILEDQNIRIRASFKDIFRVPTFNDLYYTNFGSRTLKPEKAKQYNLGLTWSGIIYEDIIDYFTISLDGYHNTIIDKIIAMPKSLFVWSMINLGKVNIAGADLNISTIFTINPKMSIELSGNYSYQYAINLSDPESKSYKNQIPYTPRHSGNLTASWLNKWVNLSYIMTGVGKRYSAPQNIENNKLDAYLEHSITLNHSFDIRKTKLKLQAECLNITNRQYEVIANYPMPGRSYRLTLKFTY